MNDRLARINAAIRALGFAQRSSADEWVRESGLTRQQAFTIGYIEEHQDRGVIARELAEISGTTAASVASLLQGLEERGLVTRTPSPDDSRVKLLRVTPAASRLTEGFEDAMIAAQEQPFAVLTPDEQQTLLSLLERVTADIEPVGPPPPRRRDR
ncbi:winged helix DNA-binding protein [Agromyces intestinalis]|uniref:Winged helix DNA-binding protein n=1 Tax=Agromyces intestinalis TaxID=2592652 RepID=A0A5C1YF77_9MICO|nr:MarR family transcriptional regulator [Agromyces intestinalis]QEO14318.1 winged helix DNA-binding protein [Agromyces intestinalis]